MLQINIACTVNQPSQLHPNHCATAHKTWFAAGIKSIFMQIGNASLCTKLSNQSCFSMKCWIVSGINLILVAKYNFAILDKYRSERLVTMLNCQFLQFNSFFHKHFILHYVSSTNRRSDFTATSDFCCKKKISFTIACCMLHLI